MTNLIITKLHRLAIWLLLFSVMFFLVLPHYKGREAWLGITALILYVTTVKKPLAYMLYAYPLLIPILAIFLPLPMSPHWPGLLRIFITIVFWGAIFIINNELSRGLYANLADTPHFSVKKLDL